MKTPHPSAGQIWKCINTVICRQTSPNRNERRMVVEIDELVEFRYPTEANFRTKEDQYLNLSTEEFLANFKYIGKVFEEVRFRNKNKMSEIIDAKLYHEEK